MEAYRSAFTQVVDLAAFPVLVMTGLVTAAALALRGQWREGMLLGLGFWVAAGLLTLAVGTTWVAIAPAAAIIAVRQLVLWSITRGRAARRPSHQTGTASR